MADQGYSEQSFELRLHDAQKNRVLAPRTLLTEGRVEQISVDLPKFGW